MGTDVDFTRWLRGELKRREWNMAELARRGGISDVQVSRIFSGEQKAGFETLRAVAKALDIPLYEVFVRAGLLPPDGERSPLVERMVEILKTLPEADQEELIEMARLKLVRTKREARGGRSARS
jgi:transcriptional regulator with XRE-family HTH domain